MVHHYIIIRSRIFCTANPLLVVSLSVPLSSFVVSLTLRSAATINSFYRKLRQNVQPNWYVELLSRKFFISHANIGIKVMHIVHFQLHSNFIRPVLTTCCNFLLEMEKWNARLLLKVKEKFVQNRTSR